MNHIQIIDWFMLKLCNPNGWKFYMQFKYINLMFRHNFFLSVLSRSKPEDFGKKKFRCAQLGLEVHSQPQKGECKGPELPVPYLNLQSSSQYII